MASQTWRSEFMNLLKGSGSIWICLIIKQDIQLTLFCQCCTCSSMPHYEPGITMYTNRSGQYYPKYICNNRVQWHCWLFLIPIRTWRGYARFIIELLAAISYISNSLNTFMYVENKPKSDNLEQNNRNTVLQQLSADWSIRTIHLILWISGWLSKLFKINSV